MRRKPMLRTRRRRIRQVATTLALLLGIDAALVAQNSGMAFALPAETTTSSDSSSADQSYGPAEAKDETSALLMARLQNRRIEVLGERTSSSTMYALPDGTFTAEAYAGPVRVKQADGSWQDVDTTLSDTGDALAPETAAADITVSDGGDEQLASVTKGDDSFGLGWASQLPDPTVKGNTASYDLGAGQTLKVEALAQSFSEDLVLTQQPTRWRSRAAPRRPCGPHACAAQGG